MDKPLRLKEKDHAFEDCCIQRIESAKRLLSAKIDNFEEYTLQRKITKERKDGTLNGIAIIRGFIDECFNKME